MQTLYTHGLVVFAPESCWPGANALACCFGVGQLHDLRSFISAQWEKSGVLYGYQDTRIKAPLAEFIQAAAEARPTLARPSWDVGSQINLSAAQDVLDQSSIIVGSIPDGFSLAPDTVLIALDVDAGAVASAIGLTRVSAP